MLPKPQTLGTPPRSLESRVSLSSPAPLSAHESDCLHKPQTPGTPCRPLNPECVSQAQLPSFQALSGSFKFTVRRHKSNKDSFSLQGGALDGAPSQVESVSLERSHLTFDETRLTFDQSLQGGALDEALTKISSELLAHALGWTERETVTWL